MIERITVENSEVVTKNLPGDPVIEIRNYGGKRGQTAAPKG